MSDLSDAQQIQEVIAKDDGCENAKRHRTNPKQRGRVQELNLKNGWADNPALIDNLEGKPGHHQKEGPVPVPKHAARHKTTQHSNGVGEQAKKQADKIETEANKERGLWVYVKALCCGHQLALWKTKHRGSTFSVRRG